MSNSAVRVASYKPLRGFCLLFWGFFTLLALLDYHPETSRFYQFPLLETDQGNRFGFIGVYFCFYACRWLGATVWLLPIYALWIGGLSMAGFAGNIWRKNVICFLLTFPFGGAWFAFLQYLRWVQPNYRFYSAGKGGLVGSRLFENCFRDTFGSVGCGLLLTSALFLLLVSAFANAEDVWRIFLYLLRRILRFFARLSVKVGVKIFKGRLPKLPFGFVTRWFLKITRWFLKKIGRFFLKIRQRQPKTAGEGALEKPIDLSEAGVPQNLATAYYSKKTAQSAEDLWKVSASDSEIKAEAVRTEEIPLSHRVQSKADILEPKAVANNVVSTTVRSEEKIEKPAKIPVLASETVEKSTKNLPSHSGSYQLPGLDLLKDPPPVLNDGNTEDYYETANDLVQKLAEFGVEVKVEAIQSGPVITRYEVTPARGVRVEKITTLDKNIALGLKALSVRIQAPVPGKGCVGIEVPNKKPLPVCLREILASKAWEQSDAEIPIVLGKEVTGKPIVADLTKMPHLLIAGSTGSGKTVCINAIIASLLFRETPKNLRFIMVDPKIVEMKIYNDLPHMLIPVVTDPKRVPGALKWLIGEMERRYQLFARYGARNIAAFNEKIAKNSPSEITNGDAEHLPYIVCIIDELADLMMVAPGDIETCIARLAQLARAAGIHLIIATQRPSVNVITGIIKANLPSRIAFKVASKVDSRTILDMGGADSLIGKGDMLFIPPGASQLIRAQGAWVSDDEITNLVDFLKRNGAPEFAEDVQQRIEAETDDNSNDALPSVNDEDALLPQALEILKTADRVSTSLLQRRLKIGYNRAARMMDELEKRGLVKNGEG